MPFDLINQIFKTLIVYYETINQKEDCVFEITNNMGELINIFHFYFTLNEDKDYELLENCMDFINLVASNISTIQKENVPDLEKLTQYSL